METYSLNQDAEDDLAQLYRYGIIEFGLVQADTYFDRLFMRFDEIAAHPQLFMRVDDIRKGYRRSVIGAHSIYYRMQDNGVEIMRILGRQDPTRQL